MNKIILSLAACAMIASCTKKEDKDPIDVSKTTLVMDGKWQLKAISWLPDVNDPTSFPVDDFSPLPGCEKDNFLIFKTKSNVTLFENGSKCSISAPDSIEYMYTLTNDDKFIRIYANAEDPANSSILAGDVKYPTVDSFIVTYTKTNPQNNDLTSRYVKTYVKFK
jgi:hypothetical protein